MKLINSILLLVCMLGVATAKDRPNVVLIFIDDMGYGDIGPFGNIVNKTPSLDRMAKEGNVLRQFYVANTNCTPSRAALMTGTYASRIGMDGDVLFSGEERGLNPEEITIAEMLKMRGYATGCFGKWHLGDQPEFLPLAQGFDEYFGIPYSNDMWPGNLKGHRHTKQPYTPLPVLRQNEVVAYVSDGADQSLLCEAVTDAAVQFIEDHQNEPFFCYVPHAYVHRPRFARPAILKKAGGDVDRANVEEVDTSVGRILDKLRELRLDKKTLVVFTSDNGGASGMSMGPLRGGKGGPKYEGHMREPTITWWPGTIPSGAVSNGIAVTTDLLPSLARLAEATVPDDRVIDGRDVLDILLGKPNAKSPHDVHYYEIDGVRRGPWKLVRRGQKRELYNLEDDLGEREDLAKKRPGIVEELDALLDVHAAAVAKTTRPAGFVKPGMAKPLITAPGDLPRLRDFMGLPDTIAFTGKKGSGGNAKPKTAQFVIKEREIEIQGRYLLIPVDKKITAQAFRGEDKAMQQQLEVYVDGVLVHFPSVDLAHKRGDIAFWGQLDMSEYVGKKARLRMWVLNEKAKEAVPANTRALAMIDTGNQPRGKYPLYRESLRPQLRFSQMRGWNNDTNGMLYYDGEYHLFWQANPVGLAHANMYWGHAVSTDLVHWKELSEALRPFAQNEKSIHPALAVGHCHSGGGAVDFNNTGGWQTGEDKVLLLTFTDTGKEIGRGRHLPGFTESIAYSNDRGRTWNIWDGNPIIRHVGRDPKLFWYEQGTHWSIAVYDEDSSGRGIAFYKSIDLKNWERTGKLDGFFECPEIFHAPVTGVDGKECWVMFGGDGQYVVGDFNGSVVVPEHEGKHRFIYGCVYAGQCFSNAPEDRIIYVGWARGLNLPDMPFNQGFTLPIEFTLHETPDGVRIRGYPAKEFNVLRSRELFAASNKRLAAGETISFEAEEQLADIELTVTPAPRAEKLVLAIGDVKVGYNFKTGQTLGLPMRRGGKNREPAPVQLVDGKLQMRVVVDRPMCEVFYNTGEIYALIPKNGGRIGKLTLEIVGTVEELKIYGMESIWE